MTTSTLPSSRSAALRAVSTVAGALREFIADDPEQGRALLSELHVDEVEAILPAVNALYGALATVELAKKATR